MNRIYYLYLYSTFTQSIDQYVQFIMYKDIIISYMISYISFYYKKSIVNVSKNKSVVKLSNLIGVDYLMGNFFKNRKFF